MESFQKANRQQRLAEWSRRVEACRSSGLWRWDLCPQNSFHLQSLGEQVPTLPRVMTVTLCIFRPCESMKTVGVSPPSREKQVQVHGRESTGVLFWKEMAKERFAKRSSACHLFRLESFSFAHGVISIDEDLVGTVLNPVQHSIC